MNNKLPILKVRVFGGFSVTYGDQPISFGRNSMTKAVRLLVLLLCESKNGIAREKLQQELYDREDLADVSNNLRVTVHRLKKMLMDVGLPSYEYVRIQKGVYQWDAPMEIQMDSEVFDQLIESAEAESTEENKIKTLKNACQLYGSDFVPELSGETWALIKAVQYKEKYSKTLHILCDLLMSRGEYEEVLRLCGPACEMYPFDEWQVVRIECYIAMKQYKEAMEEYENAANLFFEELGMEPTEKMLEQFETMSRCMNYTPQEIKDIKNRLKEKEQNQGAYYCGFPSFRDNYRLISRIIERNGQSVYMLLCSITNGKGQLMENGDKLEFMAQELFRTFKHCLRRGDAFTKYSQSQFLAIVVGTDKESCKIIFDRITQYFSREHKSWAHYLEFYVTTVAEIEKQDSKIRFDDKDAAWHSKL